MVKRSSMVAFVMATVVASGIFAASLYFAGFSKKELLRNATEQQNVSNRFPARVIMTVIDHSF